MEAIDDHRPAILVEALHSLRTLRLGIPMSKALRLLDCRDSRVASAALMYLCRVYPKIGRDHLPQALRSRRYLLREAAVDEIDEADFVEFIPEVRMLAKDRVKHVRQAAETALANLEVSAARIEASV
jgi:hypothetical protein